MFSSGNELRITRDWLHLLTGVLALAFGIYCIIVGIGAVAFEWVEFSLMLFIICFIFGILYILSGIFTLVARPGGVSSFIAVGFFMGTYWWSSGLPWFMWPMIFMPVVILVLTIIMLLRSFSRKKEMEWG